MTLDQKRLVVHFVKQLQQCIEKREPVAVSGRAGQPKESASITPVESLTCQCGRGKK